MKLYCTAVFLTALTAPLAAAQAPPLPRHLAGGIPAPTPSPSNRLIFAEADLNFDATLPGNDQLIGVQIHTGSSTVNGPVNLILCGSAPLPTQNGPCSDSILQSSTTKSSRFLAWFIGGPALGAWDLGITNATAIPGATTIATGAATTPPNLLGHIDGRHATREFRLRRVQCPPKSNNAALCLGTIGQVSSDQTNHVQGLPAPFPPKAGLGKPIKTPALPNNNVMVFVS